MRPLRSAVPQLVIYGDQPQLSVFADLPQCISLLFTAAPTIKQQTYLPVDFRSAEKCHWNIGMLPAVKHKWCCLNGGVVGIVYGKLCHR